MPVFRVAQGALAPGDTVTFTYGDRSGGSKGLRLQTLSTDNLLLPIYVDVEGKGRFVATEWPALVVSGMAEAVAAARAGAVGGGDRRAVRRRGAHRGPLRQSVGGRLTPGYELAVDGEVVARLARGDDGVAIAKGLRLSKAGHLPLRCTLERRQAGRDLEPGVGRSAPRPPRLLGRAPRALGLRRRPGRRRPVLPLRARRRAARLRVAHRPRHRDGRLGVEDHRRGAPPLRQGGRVRRVPRLRVERRPRDWAATTTSSSARTGRKRVPRQEAPVLDALYPRLARENGADNVLVIPHAHNAADWNQSDAAVERLVEIASHARHLRVVRQPLSAERLRARVHRRIRRPSLEAGTRARPLLLAAAPARRPGRGDRAGEDGRRHLRRAARRAPPTPPRATASCSTRGSTASAWARASRRTRGARSKAACRAPRRSIAST